MLIINMSIAVNSRLPEETPAFTNSGTAEKIAIIIATKCVKALPGSLIVICIRFTIPF